ncbi:unnamed protein product [Calypogeia fissa]
MPMDAATKTPQALALPNGRVSTIAESEEDQFAYKLHFSQGPLKDDKARKLANRTPEADGKGAEKIGKKQRKQLQFTTQGEAPKRGETSSTEHREPVDAAAQVAKEHNSARKVKTVPADRGERIPLDANMSGPADRRRGKEIGARKSSPKPVK